VAKERLLGQDPSLCRDCQPRCRRSSALLFVFAITGPRASGGAILLNDVKDLRIGWSRAAADTALDRVDSKTL
jgi:hypothetical protein